MRTILEDGYRCPAVVEHTKTHLHVISRSCMTALVRGTTHHAFFGNGRGQIFHLTLLYAAKVRFVTQVAILYYNPRSEAVQARRQPFATLTGVLSFRSPRLSTWLCSQSRVSLLSDAPKGLMRHGRCAPFDENTSPRRQGLQAGSLRFCLVLQSWYHWWIS